MCDLDSSGSEYRSVAGSCEHVDESPIKGGEFLDQLSDSQRLKKDSVP
jgi:hypothetical protein